MKFFTYVSDYHSYTFHAEESEGEKIVEEIDRRRREAGQSELGWSRLPSEITTFEKFFEERPKDRM